MVDELRDLFERAQQQPEDVQRRIAEIVKRELDDQDADAWEPTAEERVAIEASRAEYEAGHGLDYDDYARQRRDQQA